MTLLQALMLAVRRPVHMLAREGAPGQRTSEVRLGQRTSEVRLEGRTRLFAIWREDNDSQYGRSDKAAKSQAKLVDRYDVRHTQRVFSVSPDKVDAVSHQPF